MIGAQAGSMSNLSYTYFTSERGWSGVEDLRRQRLDLLTSTVCRFGIGTLLQVAAAATILPLGLKPQSAEQLVRIFSDSMGVIGKVIFGLGLWGICFSSFVSGTMGYSLIVRDICRRYVPGLKVAADSATPDGEQPSDPVYKWSVALLGLSPLYIVFLSVEPIGLTLVVRSMVVIVIPVLVGSLMKIANDKRLMESASAESLQQRRHVAAGGRIGVSDDQGFRRVVAHAGPVAAVRCRRIVSERA